MTKAEAPDVEREVAVVRTSATITGLFRLYVRPGGDQVESATESAVHTLRLLSSDHGLDAVDEALRRAGRRMDERPPVWVRDLKGRVSG